MNGASIAALASRDTRSILRDPLLFFLLLYGAVLALVARLVGPYLPVAGIELYLAPGVVILAALLGGAVLGFSLVEERETQTWLLFRVLPAGSTTFATYLVTATALVALASAAISAVVYGRPVLDGGAFAGGLLAAALGAPVFLLFLGAFASNKIEALAMYKIGGSATTAPIFLFLLPPDWQWCLWWNPWYWIYLGLLRGYGDHDALRASGIPFPIDATWPYTVLPVVLCALACGALARRFRRLAR